MESIIVTVTDLKKRYFYDVEIPTGVAVDKLGRDIVDTLNGYADGLHLDAARTRLFCNRLGRQLLSEETAETAGVWNGDYITMIEV